MTERTATAAPKLLAALIGPCPTCGNGRLRAVFDGEQTNFHCTDCRACWHGEVAFVHRVDPGTCAGCPAHASCVAGPGDAMTAGPGLPGGGLVPAHNHTPR
jgi:hypothetical protein